MEKMNGGSLSLAQGQRKERGSSRERGFFGGILTQGFFLNSSRILKDFRKKYNMPCHECKLRPN
jgi:hypothetical protein